MRVDVEEVAASQNGGKPAKSGGGLLSSFVRNLGVNVVGTAALSREDIQPALTQLKRKLMERNVAEEIAEKCVAGLMSLTIVVAVCTACFCRTTELRSTAEGHRCC